MQSLFLEDLAAIRRLDEDLVIFHGLGARAGRMGHPGNKIFQTYLHSIQMNALAEKWVPDLGRSLSDAGVKPVLLKGWGLAKRLYQNPEDRSFYDIDLLVSQKEMPIAAAIIVFEGFEWVEKGPRVEANEYKSEWVHRDHPLIKVELHTQVGYGAYEIKEWEKRIAFDSQIGMWLLDPVDEAVYLLFHMAIQHRFQRLIWLLDFDLFLKKYSIDLADLKKSAKQVHSERALAMALDLLQFLNGKNTLKWCEKVVQGKVDQSKWEAAKLRAKISGGWLLTLKYALQLALSLKPSSFFHFMKAKNKYAPSERCEKKGPEKDFSNLPN